MIARRDERVREPREQAAAVVADRRGLAVHLCLRARDGGAERLPDRLVAEADAEDRRGRAEAPDHLDGDPAWSGLPGPGETTTRSGARARMPGRSTASLRS